MKHCPQNGFQPRGAQPRSAVRLQRGFTLIELMMVLVLVAILLGIGAPSFQESIQRNRLQSTVSRLSSTVSLARVEAITRVASISMCASVDLATCGGSNWESGYLVFVDDGAGAGTALDGLISGDEELLRIVDPAGNGVTIRSTNFASTTALTFMETGMMMNSDGGALTICNARGAAEARAIIVGPTGQIRLSSNDDNSADGVHEDGEDPANALVCPT